MITRDITFKFEHAHGNKNVRTVCPGPTWHPFHTKISENSSSPLYMMMRVRLQPQPRTASDTSNSSTYECTQRYKRTCYSFKANMTPVSCRHSINGDQHRHYSVFGQQKMMRVRIQPSNINNTFVFKLTRTIQTYALLGQGQPFHTFNEGRYQHRVTISIAMYVDNKLRIRMTLLRPQTTSNVKQ